MAGLSEEKIFENLCSNDERNPCYYWIEGEGEEKPIPRAEHCACDACFYGKDKLAMEILRLIDLTRAAIRDQIIAELKVKENELK